ncbi:hypothetical protein DFQ27_009187 [Actinomortierella ambigua]|uniref:EF-hand domain-containing protein n=1 Tax=Actinomortierella ambigua TaxID=1343610 RepID=A0A9P6QH43_9FUNG|nr:hypothetical protein DFQ27_009187 [Actinomortierella ambigua]
MFLPPVAEHPPNSNTLHPLQVPPISTASGSPPNVSHSPSVSTNSAAFPSQPQRQDSDSSSPSLLPVSTTIEIERILKEEDMRHNNDFVPPRQAMNSDDSDFDWDEDVNFDEKSQKRRRSKSKKRSTWRKLSPFLRMVIQMIIITPIAALPAILTLFFYNLDHDGKCDDPTTTNCEAFRQLQLRDTVLCFFFWIAFMCFIACWTNWSVDVVPMMVLRFLSCFKTLPREKVKTRLLLYVETKKYLKWFIDSCWATGSFALLSQVIYRNTVGVASWRNIFQRVLVVIIVGFALILVEKLTLQWISYSFHQIAYADRITESKYALQTLDRLGVATAKKHKKTSRPTHSRNNTVDQPGDFFGNNIRSRQQSRANSLDMSNSDTVPMTSIGADTLPRFAEGHLVNTPLATPTGEYPHSSRNSTQGRNHRDSKQKPEIRKGLKNTLHGIALANETPTKDINSTANAKQLAKTLFYNLQRHTESLVVEDFMLHFDDEEEARRAFALFDKDGNGDISKREMKEKIFYIYKERKDLHTSMRDMSQAVGKLNIIFMVIVVVLWLFIILSIFGQNIVQNLLSIGSFLLALSFVFGNSVKTLFENIVFLFITHPYDSGDLCSIDGTEMFVREVGLNSTMFVTWDGKRMYYPNNLLSTRPIHNIRRSPNMSEKIVLNIDIYTPAKKIIELRARMRDFLARETKEFLPDMEIQIQELDLRLKISMVIEHKGNWQDSGRRWNRRTKFHFALKEAMEDLDIKYYALPARHEIVNSYDIEPHHNRSSRSDEDQDTLSPTSPLRNLTPDQIARLYRRPTYTRPQGGD